MIKKLFLFLIILLVAAAAAVYFFGSAWLNEGVKTGVEKYGPRVTQTEVRLDEVDLSVFSGSGTLRGLYVDNPEGFKSEHIFALEQIDVNLDTSTILKDKIVIDRVHIRKPEISYEKSFSSSNVKELLDNIEAFTGPSEAKEDDGAKKQVVIRELIIEDGTIYVGAMGIGRTVPLPRIEMRDIGEGGERVTMAEAVNLVLTQVLQSIGPALADAGKLLQDGGGAVIDAAKKQGLDRVDKAAKDAAEKASEGIRSLLGN